MAFQCFLQFLNLFAIIHLIAGVQIEITPTNYTDQTASNEVVQITCSPGNVLQCADKDVLMLQLRKNGYEPKAFVNIKHGRSTATAVSSSFQTTGRIRDECNKSFLRVTLSSPQAADSGRYECSMFYYDNSGAYVEENASGTLTVELLQVNSIVKNLMNKVSELENKLEDQESKGFQVDSVVENLLTKVSELEKNQKDQASEDASDLPFQRITLEGDEYLYYIPGHRLNYFGARDYCYSLGAHLVHFDSVKEYDAVKSFLDKQKTQTDSSLWYFVDGNDIDQEGVWVSGKDGTPMDPSKLLWIQSQPDNYGNEDCMSVRGSSDGLNDYPCTTDSDFICEKTPK